MMFIASNVTIDQHALTRFQQRAPHATQEKTLDEEALRGQFLSLFLSGEIVLTFPRSREDPYDLVIVAMYFPTTAQDNILYAVAEQREGFAIVTTVLRRHQYEVFRRKHPRSHKHKSHRAHKHSKRRKRW